MHFSSVVQVSDLQLQEIAEVTAAVRGSDSCSVQLCTHFSMGTVNVYSVLMKGTKDYNFLMKIILMQKTTEFNRILQKQTECLA